MDNITIADFSRLSEADCKRALPLVWKMLDQSMKGVGLLNAINHAYGERLESKEKLLRRWDAEANKQCQEVDRQRAEAEAAENRLKELTASVKTGAKRLAKLSSPPKKAHKGKPLNEAEILNAAVGNAERTVEAEREKAKMFEKQLSDAADQLGSLRAQHDEASAKCFDLEKQLKVALENGVVFEKKYEELEEKVRCPICMDREKNVSFACGHAYCEQCATEWNTCSYNCKRPNSGKPVKFRYPLFLC
ncbi:E3 ubiquitin-protein ligase MIB2-like protein [Aphelenchoides avenae]|nr:E3 ubiquitin-protein ligase MIB2-like protein [Aphelenchus avenae]